jgi:hypothetical protein
MWGKKSTSAMRQNSSPMQQKNKGKLSRFMR